MKIVLHDFAGHPGQLQLSRELARRGHSIQHQYCNSVTTGRGATSVRPDDPETFSVKSIDLGGEFARYSPLRRIFQELRYGYLTIEATLEARPDVAVFANVPILPLAMVSLALRARAVPYIFWWQDVYSEAVGAIVRHRFGRLGSAVAWLVERIERGVARRAAAIVPITDLFMNRLDAWGVDSEKVHVIPNWGALDEVSPRARQNAWSKAHGLDDVKVVMYAGTLGLKHDPSLIAELVRGMPDDCRVVVVSQGKGREWLEDHCRNDSRLILLDYQPYENLSDMLGSADVVLAILEDDASRYSVPSKVLTYLCAGRPILALLPLDNAVARVVASAEAGMVIPPSDRRKAADALNRLLSDSALRSRLSENGRFYAERVFDMQSIADDFSRVIVRAGADRASRSPEDAESGRLRRE